MQRTYYVDALEIGLEQGKLEGKAEGLAEGLSQGLAEGISQGHLEGVQQVAGKLLALNMSISEIATITGLSADHIAKLAQAK